MGLDDLLTALERMPTKTSAAVIPKFGGPSVAIGGSPWTSKTERVFTEALPKVVPGWESRSQQIQMARIVDQGLRHGKVALAEAGTGTGKSLALLVPAALHARET